MSREGGVARIVEAIVEERDWACKGELGRWGFVMNAD
jgi:hypothetical protein